MSYEFLNSIDVLKAQKPETLEDYLLRELKIIQRMENLHLTSKIFYQFKLQLDYERTYLIAIPQNLIDINVKKNYINACKIYKSLEEERCVRNFRTKHCNYKINIYQFNNNEIPLETYLQLQQISQSMLLRIAQSLIRAIQSCHQKVYFLENLSVKTIYMDIITKEIKLLNPIQKIALQEEIEIEKMKKREKDNHLRRSSYQNTTIKTNQLTNLSDGPCSPKGNVKKNESQKVGKIIDKDMKGFVNSILAAARIKSVIFEEMIEFNVLFSFFQNNYSGQVTKSMQYFLMYLWKVQKDDLSIKPQDIEIMIANILYSEIKTTQARQFMMQSHLKRMESLQVKPQMTHQKDKENNQSKLSKVNSEVQLGKERISLLLSQQKQQIQKSPINLKQQQNKLQSSHQQTPNFFSEKLKTQPNSLNGQQPSELQKEKLRKVIHKQKSLQLMQSNDTTSQSEKKSQACGFEKFLLENKVLKSTFTNQTFQLNQYNNCMKDQTDWINRIDNSVNKDQDVYMLLQHLERKKNKTDNDWKKIAQIQFKYQNFFKEPLEILKQKVLRRESEQNKNIFESDDECFSMMGMINLKWRKIPEAISAFKTALKLNSRNQNALYYLGKHSCIVEKDNEKGMSYFQQLIQINPYNSDLIRKITKILTWNYIANTSELIFWQFLALVTRPKCQKTLLMLAKSFFNQQNYKLAIFFCVQGIDVTKKEKEFYFLLGLIFFKLCEFRKSQKFLIKADKLNHQQSAKRLCHLYLKQDDLEELEVNFHKKIKQDKSNYHSQLKYTLYLYDQN